jgi:DNA-binding NarL/FixJ family response regulator
MANVKSRILVVDDHPIVVDGYRQLINCQRDMVVCGVASTALEAINKTKLTKPHLAVVDLVLKESDGLDLIKDLRTGFAELKLLVVSARDESVFAERALHAGAAGYVCKQEATLSVIEAIRRVLDGKIYLSSRMTDLLLSRAYGTGHQPDHPEIDALGDRELQAFELFGRGLTTRQIAAQMHVSCKTVDRYRENIKAKLHLYNGNELLRRATLWVERSGCVS